MLAFVAAVLVIVLVAVVANVSEGTVEVLIVVSFNFRAIELAIVVLCNVIAVIGSEALFVIGINAVFSVVLAVTALVCTSATAACDVDVVGIIAVP